MVTDRKSRLSERYARVWDLLASVAAADCACNFTALTVHGHDAVVRNKRICPACAAQEALRALAAAALEKSIKATQWRELPKAVEVLDQKGL